MSMPPRPPKDLATLLDTLASKIGEVFLGKPEVIRLALVALLADGHLLLEDVPGVGKTLLAKSLARSLACQVQSHPVHARPAAWRLDRSDNLSREERRVCLSAGSSLRGGCTG